MNCEDKNCKSFGKPLINTANGMMCPSSAKKLGLENISFKYRKCPGCGRKILKDSTGNCWECRIREW